jgi:uroporphyrinogen decarboxylase
LQGGMSPKFLLKTDLEMFNEANKYLDTFRDVPYIFNLGHGIVPETNPEKVEKLINYVKDFK